MESNRISHSLALLNTSLQDVKPQAQAYGRVGQLPHSLERAKQIKERKEMGGQERTCSISIPSMARARREKISF